MVEGGLFIILCVVVGWFTIVHSFVRSHGDVIQCLIGGGADVLLLFRSRDGILCDRDVVFYLIFVGFFVDVVIVVDDVD